MTRVCLFVFAAITAQTNAQSTDAEIAKFRDAAANAVGTIAAKGEWTFRGTQAIHGSDQPLTLTIDRSFRFSSKASGQMPEAQGFDGKVMWQMNGSGVPHPVYYSDRDLSRLDMYVLSGLWTASDSPVKILSVKGDTCEVRCIDGEASATLTLDSATHLPKSMSYWSPQGSQTWVYSDYKRQHGLMVPSLSKRDSGDNHEKVEIASAGFTESAKADYSIPKTSVDGYTYDLAANPNIEVKRIFGYLFINPKINGQDEGWFFLDTGAEVMVLDPAVAKKYNAKTVGKEAVSGVVGSVTTDFVQGLDFQIGPATIRKSSYMLLDMTEFSKALGIKLAGICGYDLISRVSLDIDPAKNTIGVYPPGKAALPEGSAWSNFLFHGNIPSMICQFEGNHEGSFSLDTGSGSTVDFFSPIVAKYEMLKDRKVTTSRTGGAGGSAESKAGMIDWFQMGAKRFEKPRVVFQIADRGAFASPYEAGNIGMGFMSKFRMILDYQNSRLAFIEKS